MRPSLASHVAGRRTLAALLLLPLVAACGGGGEAVGPGGGDGNGGGGGGGAVTPGLKILAGAGVTDTVQAAPAMALKVSLGDAAGKPVAGAVVRFTAVPVKSPSGVMAPSVFVGSIDSARVDAFLATTTNASGLAYARVQLGSVAGPAAVVISVPAAGLEDTARFTVQPGNPAKVVLPIVDTTITVGHTLQLGGEVQDRHGNRRPEAVTYTVAGGDLLLLGGQLSASVPARAAVIGGAGAGATPDTTWVSVVPVATIATRRGTKLVVGNLDGSGLVEIPHAQEVGGAGIEWHPSGQSLLTTLGSFTTPYALYRVGLDGTTTPVLASSYPPAKGFSVPGGITGFTYSPDGQWVYVSGNNCNYNGILYRVPVANPAAIERLSPDGGADGVDECFNLVHMWPSVSPDGTRLAYHDQTGYESGYSIRVLNVEYKASVPLAPVGRRPRWAPSGNRIAYWNNDQVWIVDLGGYNAHAVSPAGHRYVPGVTWSPDGQWLLARVVPRENYAGTVVALINATSGLEIPLPWTAWLDNAPVVWKPTP